MVGQGLVLAVTGALLGTAVALATACVLRALLYEAEPADPATFATIAVLLSSVVLVASWLPAPGRTR